ncbi:PrsW family intramembrane metalloprotease [Actinomyces trachealis]|uniref:PrsW family intramembrane metalloprotease n=1 Tax=Actinomyces trachealis TaxID=2763540 RepID=UPI001892CD07|nr:PrsW family intramembrane metalloprotease [Actinomyces trachealis]
MTTYRPADGWAPRPGYTPKGRGLPLSKGQADGITYEHSVTWTQPETIARSRRKDYARYGLTVLGGLGLLIMLWVIAAQAGGASGLLIPTLLALIPLGIVLGSVIWVDRWEPEPFGLLLTAFLWGAGVATLISMLVNTTSSSLAYGATGDPYQANTFSAVITAPLVEEGTKGLGVLLIFLIWRRNFDGPVDGVVYAAVCAAGFAFAENILYFVKYQDSIIMTFVLRGVASPFAHIMFTASTGLALGLSTGMRSRQAWVWMAPLGLAGAIGMHAFWNGVLGTRPAAYFAVEVPLFIGFVSLVVALRAAEQKTLRNRLIDYARSGWFVPTEIEMLSTFTGRRLARDWAGCIGPRQGIAMADFQKAASELANLRRRAMQGHAEADFQVREQALLDRVVQARRVYLGQV